MQYSKCQGIQGYFEHFWCAFTSTKALYWQNKKLQVKNEPAALEGRKSKTVVSSGKRKIGTDQLLTPLPTSKEQKAEEASASQEWMDAAGGKKLLLNFVREMDCQRAFWEMLLSWLSTFSNSQFSRCIVMDSHFPNNKYNSSSSCFTSTFTLHFVRSLLSTKHNSWDPPAEQLFPALFHSPGTLTGEHSGRAPGQPTEKAGQALHCYW